MQAPTWPTARSHSLRCVQHPVHTPGACGHQRDVSCAGGGGVAAAADPTRSPDSALGTSFPRAPRVLPAGCKHPAHGARPERPRPAGSAPGRAPRFVRLRAPALTGSAAHCGVRALTARAAPILPRSAAQCADGAERAGRR